MERWNGGTLRNIQELNGTGFYYNLLIFNTVPSVPSVPSTFFAF